MDQPLWKNANRATFLNRCFHTLERLLFILNVTKHLFSAYIAKNEKKKKFKYLTKTMALWENANFATFLNRCFYSLERLVLYSQRPQNLFWPYFAKNGKEEKMTNFLPKPWTNFFGKMQILRLS